MTISPSLSKRFDLKSFLPETRRGSRNSPPVRLPSFTGLLPTKLLDFSPPSSAPITSLDPAELEDDWQRWLVTLFPDHLHAVPGIVHPDTFAAHHTTLWEWVFGVEPGIRPAPFVAIWPRGGAKSTSAELACVAIAARGIRPYVLYISETQRQADDHVANIGTLLESSGVETYYPGLGERKVGKFGAAKAWRRNRLRTASGFTIDALGFDSASRGVKIEGDRPGLIVLDDIDDELDSVAITEKKIETLTKKFLPTGSSDAAVLAVQNLILPSGIFARLAGVSEYPADFLYGRVVSGPHPALVDAAYEQGDDGKWRIVAGTPTWQGQNLAACQQFVDTFGLTAFRSECQHEVDAPDGGMFSHLVYRHCTWDAVPDLVRVVVWVDPAVTSTDQSDAHGIQVDGIAADRTIYRLWSWEARTTPLDAMARAIRKAVEHKAQHVGVETDQGGDTWRSVYAEAARSLGIVNPPPFRYEKAGAGHGPKAHRASQMLAGYERGQIIHVIGTHVVLERALRRFPKTKPFDLVDAAFWAWHDLSPPRQSGTVISTSTTIATFTPR